MKKTTILLCLLFITGAGCSSTRTASSSSWSVEKDPQLASGRHVEQRVEGQFAREAGFERRGRVGKGVAVETTLPQTPMAVIEETEAEAQGGMGGVGQGQGTVVVASEGCGLETVDQADIELRKEELVVGKRQVSNGGILIRKIVATETVNKPIDLRREEYVLERIPASEARDLTSVGSPNAFMGREIYLPLTREEALAGKRTLLTESIQFGKRIETDRETVSAPVRTEDVEIVKNPNLSDPRFANVPRKPAPGSPQPTIVPAAAGPGETSGGQMQLAREELIVGKREVEHGGLYLRKLIRTETASQPIELKREELVIERTPMGDKPVSAATFDPREITINLTREEAVAGTRNYPTEIVRLRKQVHTDTENVTGTVRSEKVEVVKLAEKSAAMLGQGGTGSGTESGTVFSSDAGYATPETLASKDQAINERVRSALANGTLGRKYTVLSVSTHEGVVTLRGTVDSTKEKAQLAKGIAKMSGVRGVKNELKTLR
jgi:uncharacterized protein (TIGR02271 family)